MAGMDIYEKYQKLLDAQNTHSPMLTIREMGEVLNTGSTSYVKFILEKLVKEGLAVKERRGLRNVYRIVSPSYKHNPQADE
jgi:predicted transcriptional regulator